MRRSANTARLLIRSAQPGPPTFHRIPRIPQPPHTAQPISVFRSFPRRLYSTSVQAPVTTSTETTKPSSTRPAWRPAPHRNPDEPVYDLYFTCKVCKERSGHTISKQGYHKGTVLVKCPNCENRHLISDHLKIFSDKSVTLEQLLADQGEAIQKGIAPPTDDMEFWAEAAVKGTKPIE